MITRRTKIQLLVFVIITMLGVTYVGARYARLGSLFYKDHYTVTAHLAQSGGIYQGGEVDYRGVKIGQVGPLTLTDKGVDVALDIDKKWDKIPSNTLAVVGNRSAIGEQYVELQPQQDAGPYLADGSQIAQPDTSTPLPTEKLLGDTATTVDSVDKKALTTTITELGKAFNGTGPDLQQIIDTSTSFINTANDNFDVTTDLIRDSHTVLQTQIDSEDDIKSFSRDLSLFTGTLAGSNQDLIRLLDNGAAAATQLRTFLDENKVDLGQLLSEVVTTGQIVEKRLPGIKQILVIYPAVAEGGYSVVDKDPATGKYNAHFGLVLTTAPMCTDGYHTPHRTPQDTKPLPLDTTNRCTDPPSKSDPRGSQNAPQRAAADYRAPVVASYDQGTGKVTWGAPRDQGGVATPAPASYGDDAWKWLYLEPLTGK